MGEPPGNTILSEESDTAAFIVVHGQLAEIVLVDQPQHRSKGVILIDCDDLLRKLESGCELDVSDIDVDTDFTRGVVTLDSLSPPIPQDIPSWLLDLDRS